MTGSVLRTKRHKYFTWQQKLKRSQTEFLENIKQDMQRYGYSVTSVLGVFISIES